MGSFWGLFVITGGTSTIALLFFIFRSGSRWYRQAVAPSEAQSHLKNDHSSDDHEMESQASHEIESNETGTDGQETNKETIELEWAKSES